MSVALRRDRIISIESVMEQNERRATLAPVRVRDLEDALSAARAEETEAKTLNALLQLLPPPVTAADRAARAATIAASVERVSAAQEARRDAERAFRAARVQPEWDRERLWEAGS